MPRLTFRLCMAALYTGFMTVMGFIALLTRAPEPALWVIAGLWLWFAKAFWFCREDDSYRGLTGVEDARSLTTTRKVDGFGRVIEEVSPDCGTLTYWYDNADNVTRIVDGDGVQTDFTYDASGRRLTATFPSASGENITYAYDSIAGGNFGKGRLTSIDDESGSSAYRWDAQGRLVEETKAIQAQTYALGYAYDTNGRVTEITLPSGRTVAYTRGADGLVSAVSTKATPLSSPTSLASGVAWQPFGPLKTLLYGNGLTLNRTYDQNSWLERVEVKATGATPLDLTFGRNANGELISVTDSASTGRAATYGYTNAGWLNAANGAWGDDSYSYDAAGNRSQSARTIGGVTITAIPTIPSTNNRITEIRDGSSVLKRSLDYRAGGAVIEDERIGEAVYTYDYNARGRMISAAKDGVDAGHYGYDAFGRRVWRETFGTGALHLHYIFDADGRLLAEHDAATGDVVREYVWLEDEPLAVIDYSTGSAAIFYIHTGQIGEPLVMTDGSKAKVWDVAIEPFGTAKVFGTAGEALDLRLPGQWLQAETGGLFQNWMRDYDPSLGRYAQADPLGIDGGLSLYAYAERTPLVATDPTGEFVPIVAGILIGGGLDLGIQLLQNGGRFDCVDWGSVGVSAALGAFGGGIGARSLVKAAGKEWSHFIPARYFRRSSPYYKPWLPKWLDNNRWLNGNYVTLRRHYMHDIFRYPADWREWGQRLPTSIGRNFDRAPDWIKGVAGGSGIGAVTNSERSSGCGCR